MDAQDFRSLQEAYLEVVENQQIDEELTGERRKKALNITARSSSKKHIELKNMTPKEKLAWKLADRKEGGGNKFDIEKGPTKLGGSGKRGEQKTNISGAWYSDRGRGSKAARRAASLKNEEYDIYDVILSHLLDEGYAETPEAAEAIMVNMSEEWRESIIG